VTSKSSPPPLFIIGKRGLGLYKDIRVRSAFGYFVPLGWTFEV